MKDAEERERGEKGGKGDERNKEQEIARGEEREIREGDGRCCREEVECKERKAIIIGERNMLNTKIREVAL